MKERFDVTIEYSGGNFEVVKVNGVSAKEAKKFPLSAEDSANLSEFKSVEIHMMRILDHEEGTNRWCVVNSVKYWC